MVRLDPSDLLSERRYRPFRAYAFSKHARARLRLRTRSPAARGRRLAAVDARPSRIRRDRSRRTKRPGVTDQARWRRLSEIVLFSIVGQGKDDGAWSAVRAAIDPDAESGTFFGPSRMAADRPSGAARARDVERVAGVRRAPLGARRGEDRREVRDPGRVAATSALAPDRPVRHPWAMRVLVVGATGILRPAVATLAAAGDDVTGVSRGVAGIPDGVRALAVDACDREALAATLGGRHWDRAIVYRNVVRAESLPEIELRVEGRLVLVRTSGAADPAKGEPTERPNVLQLGWTDDG